MSTVTTLLAQALNFSRRACACKAKNYDYREMCATKRLCLWLCGQKMVSSRTMSTQQLLCSCRCRPAFQAQSLILRVHIKNYRTYDVPKVHFVPSSKRRHPPYMSERTVIVLPNSTRTPIAIARLQYSIDNSLMCIAYARRLVWDKLSS